MNTIPTPNDVRTHGKVWRVTPKLVNGCQPESRTMVLSIFIDRVGVEHVVAYGGAKLTDVMTDDDNKIWHGATWEPVEVA